MTAHRNSGQSTIDGLHKLARAKLSKKVRADGPPPSIQEPGHDDFLVRVLSACELSTPPGQLRIADADQLAVDLLDDDDQGLSGVICLPISMSGRDVGSLSIDPVKTLAALLDSGDWFTPSDLGDHIAWARAELATFCRIANTESHNLLPRWRDEIASAFWTVEDLKAALKSGGVEALTLRPIAETLRDVLVGRNPAGMLDQIVQALKLASDRSPEPTADQITWVREHLPPLRAAIGGIHPDECQEWQESEITAVLSDWCNGEELIDSRKDIIARRQKREPPNRIMACVIARKYGFGREFGERILAALRSQSG
jgi:hypothetical protein